MGGADDSVQMVNPVRRAGPELGVSREARAIAALCLSGAQSATLTCGGSIDPFPVFLVATLGWRAVRGRLPDHPRLQSADQFQIITSTPTTIGVGRHR